MEIGKIYFGTMLGTLIQFVIMLFFYSIISGLDINWWNALLIGLASGLVFAPMNLLLQERKS